MGNKGRGTGTSPAGAVPRLRKAHTISNEAIPEIKAIILETLGDTSEKIIRFGSYASGTPREESDIDQ
ncbi:MAG: nucleotidyltransferase domain-containing protein [Treponema sp.]|jgi:predicted nucleotidyltransferase|nr:nucleotidyltransferase domain-containing protein [Treponema sp.]